MTPKEKAEELMQKMNVIHYFKLKGKSEDYKGTPVSMYANQIKGCALIAVDEIIKELTEEISPSVHGFRHKYWQEVKQEIEQL